MNTPIRFALGLAAVVLSSAALAQESLPADAGGDAARQERMNQAYRDHQAQQQGGTVASAEEATKRDAREAGHAIHKGATATGHAIRDGVKATGHAIHTGVKATGHVLHEGVKATGHAIHEGVDKVTGK